MRTYQPERALIARETREENRRELARVLDQISSERVSRLPAPPPVSLEAQSQISIHRIREDVQRAKDVQTARILRWPRAASPVSGATLFGARQGLAPDGIFREQRHVSLQRFVCLRKPVQAHITQHQHLLEVR